MKQIPDMSSIEQDRIVLAATGENIEVRPIVSGPGGEGTISAFQLYGDAATQVLAQLGIADRDLRRFGALVAEVAVAKLVLSKGFQVVYGPSECPTHITEVDLRRPDPTVMQASVDHVSQGE